MLLNHFEQDKIDFNEYFRKEINSNSDFSTSDNQQMLSDIKLDLTVEEPSELLEYQNKDEEESCCCEKIFNDNRNNYDYDFNLIDNIDKIIENEYGKKIFEIIKFPRNNNKCNNNTNNKCLIRKRIKTFKKRKKRENKCNLLINEEIPKQKHFHFDKKKQRIVYQRNHLKVIYSIIGLSPPYNFKKYFNMIEKQIGDRTNQDFNNKKKSFHIIRVDGEEKIVTLDEKKINMKKCLE